MSIRILWMATSMLLLTTPGFAGTRQVKPPAQETVILIHGLMNTPLMMKPLERALQRKGYRVINWGYPSRDLSIEQIAERLHPVVLSTDGADTVHFVGFSLGAISARYYLSHHSVPNLGRLVQIAPPNHGSVRADRLYDYKWFQTIWGKKATRQLRSVDNEFFDSCGIPPCPIGIIAGGKGDAEGFSKTIPGDDDGTVSVESAQLAGVTDFILQRRPHTLLLCSKDTIHNVLSFLRTGRFIAGRDTHQG